MPSPTSHRIDLPTGLSYHLLEWPAEDAGTAHTVILLHGFLDFAWTWEGMVEGGRGGAQSPLGGLRILAPDLRGHGDSDRVGPGGYYHFLDYVADLHGLMDRVVERGDTVSLVGHSMGGSVAAYFAGAFPERVRRLALLEGLGPPEDPEDVPDRVRTWVAAWGRARTSDTRGYPDEQAAAARLRAHDPLLGAAEALRLARRGTARCADGQLRFKHDPLHVTPGPIPFRMELAQRFWRRVACPVLIVDGAESLFRHGAEEAARRRGAFSDSKHVVLPGAGHMMQRHQPVALAQLLGEFLSEG